MFFFRLVFIFFCLLFSVSKVFSQDAEADTSYIIKLINQATTFNVKNKKEQDSIVKEAINYSQKINRYDYALRLYNYWSFQRVLQNEYRDALALCYQGLAVVNDDATLQKNVSYRDMLAHTAMCNLYSGNKDTAVYWVEKLKHLSRQYRDSFNLSIAYVFDAISKVGVMPDKHVISLFDTAASFARTTPNLHDDALAIYNKGYFLQDKKVKDWPGAVTAYISLNNIIADESMEEYRVKIHERVPFWFRGVKTTLYGSLAKVYYYLANLNDACYYQELAHREELNKGNYVYLSYIWATLAEMEVFRNDYRKVKHIYDSCIVLLRKYHETTDVPIPSLYFAKGWLYEQENRFMLARQFYEKTLDITGSDFHPAIIALLRLYVNNGQLKEATILKSNIDSLISKTGLLFFQALYSKELVGYYGAMGQPENAVKAELEYYRYKDSLNTTARYYLVKEVETRFKTGEKEQQLAAVQQTQLLQQKLLKESNRRIWILTGGILLLAGLSIALYKIYTTRQKQSRLLAVKNQQVETLVRELHHRVKNNLQVVSSLLNLQSNRIEDDIARDALEQGKNRVDAMAMIHQKLYMDEVGASIDMRDYLQSLCLSLATSYGYNNDTILVEVSLSDTVFDIDKAIPVGLIVNELVTNAFKYAFRQTPHPLVTVALTATADDQLTLRISDNGTGFSMDAVTDKKGSFGMKLVNMLVGQLKGKLVMEQRNGAIFTITYKS